MKKSKPEKYILIIDFGSQVTQLIARRLRELKVYCEIIPFQKITKKQFKSKAELILKNKDIFYGKN